VNDYQVQICKEPVQEGGMSQRLSGHALTGLSHA